MQRLALPVSDPDDGRVCGGDEPQDHVGEVDPDGVLHADLAGLLGGGVGLDVDAAEGAEEGCPEDAVSKDVSTTHPHLSISRATLGAV